MPRRNPLSASFRTVCESYEIGGEKVPRRFTIDVDEPNELGGSNSFANPQEHLIAALNACMTVGYAAQCAVRGITLESLAIETDGEIDLRGFLGIDPAVPKGFENLSYTVRIRGNGTKEQFAEVHEAEMATSPNFSRFVPPRGPQTGVGRRVIARLEGRGSGCRQAAASLRHVCRRAMRVWARAPTTAA